MHIRTFAALALVALSATPAQARPAYLSCVYAEGDITPPFELALDEATRNVTRRDKHGFVETVAGYFTFDKVEFRNEVFEFIVDRKSLTFTRRTLLLPEFKEGKCKLIPSAPRQFEGGTEWQEASPSSN